MKTFVLLLSILVCSATACFAGSPRLALWVTDPIGVKPAEVCSPDSPSARAGGLPATAPTVTELDVTAWSRDNGRWTLNPERFARSDAAPKLRDHCFVLAIDGKLVTRGVMLSSHSARLTRFPTISVYEGDHTAYLRLTSGNQGEGSRLIHAEALDAVLGTSGALKR
jgi:hypothetical protein